MNAIVSYNPATGFALGEVKVTSSSELDQAIAAARDAQRLWAARSGLERGRVLQRAARLLRDHLPELAALESSDTGKPIAEATQADIPSAADVLEYFGGVAAALHGDHYQLGGAFVYTRREPLGVCAGIGAWNYPLQIACWKAAPALAAGNAMIFKPSDLTPLTAQRLEALFLQAGLPEHLFRVVQGDGRVGRAMSEHPGIAKVSLTGSVPTGKSVLGSAASTLKQVTLELGGKSPLIIFADADLDQAVSAAMLANFYTQGEICSNGTRVFVQAEVREAFLAKLLPRVERLRIGDPSDPATQMGALISADHLAKVMSYVQGGIAAGARLRCGGTTPTWPQSLAHLRGGHFIKPTVFDECHDEMRLVREEIFGPVMAVLGFTTEEEVIHRANDTNFGLAAGIFTRDLARAHRVAAAMEAGICWINNYNVTPVEVPFGGVKESGLGRENGLAALHYYTQLKTVYVEMAGVSSPF